MYGRGKPDLGYVQKITVIKKKIMYSINKARWNKYCHVRMLLMISFFRKKYKNSFFFFRSKRGAKSKLRGIFIFRSQSFTPPVLERATIRNSQRMFPETSCNILPNFNYKY